MYVPRETINRLICLFNDTLTELRILSKIDGHRQYMKVPNRENTAPKMVAATIPILKREAILLPS